MARQVSNAGSCDHSRRKTFHTRVRCAVDQRLFEPLARLARVSANDDDWFCDGFGKMACQGKSDCFDCGCVEWKTPGLAAYTVGSEKSLHYLTRRKLPG